MLSSHQRWFRTLTAAAVALWPLSGVAQTIGGSFDELIPGAPDIVVAIEKTDPAPTRMAPGWLERATDGKAPRLIRSTAFADSALRAVQQPAQQKRSWIGRHPVLFGALVGFGGGFLIGYLPGDDAVFDDFTAGFNGLVMGGIGAGTGAAVGAVVAATK